MRWNTFIQFWVRKLIGKPVADTTPDCEFDARRSPRCFDTGLSLCATAGNAFPFTKQIQKPKSNCFLALRLIDNFIQPFREFAGLVLFFLLTNAI